VTAAEEVVAARAVEGLAAGWAAGWAVAEMVAATAAAGSAAVGWAAATVAVVTGEGWADCAVNTILYHQSGSCSPRPRRDRIGVRRRS